MIGLSTALAILEGQQKNPRDRRTLVTIVSKEVPDLGHGTQHSAVYASVWAVSLSSMLRQQSEVQGMLMLLFGLAGRSSCERC